MSERDNAWRKFCDGNREALANHMELIGIAFTAGWLAGIESKRGRSKMSRKVEKGNG